MASHCATDSSDVTQAARAPSSSSEYNMRHGNRGYAIIINNENFLSRYERRDGTERDATAMKDLLLTLGFKEENIKRFDDVIEKDMMQIMTKAAAEDYADKDCFVCVILTHGEEDVVVTSDSKAVKIDTLLAKMSRRNCPNLKGKPKIFLIQACQGQGLDLGVVAKTKRDQHDGDDDHDGTSVQELVAPKNEPDFIIAQSSVRGYYSWRNPGRGSLFIQSLADVISENWKQHDLLSMLTEVNSKAAYDNAFLLPGFDNEAKNVLKQMPFFKSMLTKQIFFHAYQQ